MRQSPKGYLCKYQSTNNATADCFSRLSDQTRERGEEMEFCTVVQYQSRVVSPQIWGK